MPVHCNICKSFCSRDFPFFVCISFIDISDWPSHINFFVSPLMESNANLRDVYFSHIGEGVSVGGRDSPIPGPGSGPSDRCNFNIQVRYRNGPSSRSKYRYRKR
jgi:hypothetical protein